MNSSSFLKLTPIADVGAGLKGAGTGYQIYQKVSDAITGAWLGKNVYNQLKNTETYNHYLNHIAEPVGNKAAEEFKNKHLHAASELIVNQLQQKAVELITEDNLKQMEERIGLYLSQMNETQLDNELYQRDYLYYYAAKTTQFVARNSLRVKNSIVDTGTYLRDSTAAAYSSLKNKTFDAMDNLRKRYGWNAHLVESANLEKEYEALKSQPPTWRSRYNQAIELVSYGNKVFFEFVASPKGKAILLPLTVILSGAIIEKQSYNAQTKEILFDASSIALTQFLGEPELAEEFLNEKKIKYGDRAVELIVSKIVDKGEVAHVVTTAGKGLVRNQNLEEIRNKIRPLIVHHLKAEISKEINTQIRPVVNKILELANERIVKPGVTGATKFAWNKAVEKGLIMAGQTVWVPTVMYMSGYSGPILETLQSHLGLTSCALVCVAGMTANVGYRIFKKYYHDYSSIQPQNPQDLFRNIAIENLEKPLYEAIHVAINKVTNAYGLADLVTPEISRALLTKGADMAYEMARDKLLNKPITTR